MSGKRAATSSRLLDALEVRQAIVFATCVGASVGFDLAARYPGYVRAYVVHEPIVIRILPDFDEQRALFQGLCRLNEQQGPIAAYLAWTDSIGLDSEPTFGRRSVARAKRDGPFVFRHQVMEMVDFMPDLAAIKEAGICTLVAAGEGSLSGNYRYTRSARADGGTHSAAHWRPSRGHHDASKTRPTNSPGRWLRRSHRYLPGQPRSRARPAAGLDAAAWPRWPAVCAAFAINVSTTIVDVGPGLRSQAARRGHTRPAVDRRRLQPRVRRARPLRGTASGDR